MSTPDKGGQVFGGLISALESPKMLDLDGGGIVRLSKVNAVLLPEDAPGFLEGPAIVIGLHTIPVSETTAKKASAFLREKDGYRGTRGQITRFVSDPGVDPHSVGDFCDAVWEKPRASYLDPQADGLHREVMERDRDLAELRDMLKWLHEKAMQMDVDSARGLKLSGSWTDLEGAIREAMEAEKKGDA